MATRRELTKKQLRVAQSYRRAAGLDDYRAHALQVTIGGPQCRSLTSDQWTLEAFRVLMASLERLRNLAGNPAMDPEYWARMMPKDCTEPTREQRYGLRRRWEEYRETVDPTAGEGYLLGILRQATGRPDLRHELDMSRSDYALAIDAIDGRLRQAR